MTTRAAIYLRISDPHGDRDDRYGLAAQETECLAYAERQRLEVAAIYTDTITGTTEQRRGFGELLAHAGDYTDLIVYSVDRLARHPRAGYALIETASLAGLTIHTAIEGMIDLDDDAGAMNAGIRLVFADAERRRIKKRMVAGRIAKMRAGKTVHPLRAYGWKNDQVHDVEAAWVRWIYERALEVGVYTIIEELAERGVPSPTGKPRWEPTVLHHILRDSAYRGEWLYGRPRIGRRTELQTVMSAPCPRIVSDELWWGAQRALDARKTGGGRRGTRTDKFPLQGRIICAECGRAMVGHCGKNDRLYYTCGDKRHPPQQRRGCANNRYYPAGEVHEAILDKLRALAGGLDLSSYLPAPAPQPRDPTPHLAEVDKRLKRVKEAYEAGVDSLQEYKEKKQRLDAERQSILNAPIPLVPKIEHDVARTLIQQAAQMELRDAVVKLGIRVQVALGGNISLSLDPVI